MKIFEEIKKYFAKEAPYNWGASIEHFRKQVHDGFDAKEKEILEVERRCSGYLNSVASAINQTLRDHNEKIDKQAAFFSDQLLLLENKIAKLEKKIKKPKVKK